MEGLLLTGPTPSGFTIIRVWTCNIFAHGSGSWVSGNTQAQHGGGGVRKIGGGSLLFVICFVM